MSTLYLVRHGHTVVADAGLVAGFSDVDLSVEGEASLAKLRNSINNLQFSAFYTSDLKRAKRSMNLLTDKTYVADQRLKELNFGEWEGMSWNAVHQQQPELLNTWSSDWVNNRPPAGETFKELADRCGSWLKEQTNDDDQNILVTAHGGSIRALLCVAMDLPLSSAMQFEIEHASVTKLVLSDVGNRCNYVNRTTFDS